MAESNREMSEQETQFSLGRIISGNAKRDAIHIAVAPVIATERLAPGQRIGLVGHQSTQVKAMAAGQGIVDPFLQGPVFEGERFWMFLLPNSITSLRHQWTHPNFDSDSTISHDEHLEKSRKWISDHAALLGFTSETMMKHAEKWLKYEDHVVQHDAENWRSDFDPTNFWHHYEIVTGKPVPDHMRRSFYCCTC